MSALVFLTTWVFVKPKAEGRQMRVVEFSKLLVFAFMLTGVGVSGPVHAQSFDCGKAETDTERAICNTPELTRMDIEVAILYQTLETAAGTAPDFEEKIKREQANWLDSKRNACGGKIDCLDKAYKARVSELQELARNSLSIRQ